MASQDSDGALSVLTILDLCESVAGSYAARLLAGYGAQVIKVERPGTEEPSRTEAAFLALNAGKMGLTLDYETGAGAAVLSRLLEYCDGIIEDHPTRRQEEHGLSAEALIGRIPRLVICKVSRVGVAGGGGLSSSAPIAATNGSPAVSGGQPDSDEVDFGGSGLELSHGLHAFVGALGGLWRAAQTEHGQVVEIGNLETFASTLGEGLARRLNGEAMAEQAMVAAVQPDQGVLRSGGAVRAVEHPIGLATGPFAMVATPWQPGTAALLGEHTEQVLEDIAGLQASEMELLRAEGVV